MGWFSGMGAATRFVGQVGKKYKEIGAIAPSSRFLAREMTHHLRGERPPLRILEAGPGTGVVTAEIAKALKPGDQVDVVEVNGDFITYLQKRIDQESAFEGKAGQIRLLHQGLETVQGEHCYDALISGLPLNIFPSGLARQILATYRRLIKPGGTLTFFEYIAARPMQVPFSGKLSRRRLHRTGTRVRKMIEAHQFRRRAILLNVPPAYVRHLRLGVAL